MDALEKITGLKDRALRDRLLKLDGHTIKKVRIGREAKLFTMRRWEAQERAIESVRIAHTRALKPVLAQFIEGLPFVDHFGPYLRHLYGGDRIPYDPDKPLLFEDHALFLDLLSHLDLMELEASPSELWFGQDANDKRVGGFKPVAKELLEACQALQHQIHDRLRAVFQMSLVEGLANGYTRHLVRLVYDATMAQISGGLEAYRHGLPEVRIDEQRAAKDTPLLVYRQGNDQLVVRKGSRKGPFRSWAEERLGRMYNEVSKGVFLEAARSVAGLKKRLDSIRERLLKALETASYYEIFPGSCKFTGGVEAHRAHT